jgi:hypothetical protein
MSQEFTQGFGNGSGSTGGTTGSICTETSLYKSTDGKIEFIEYIAAGDVYPPFPGGNGTKKTTWTRTTVASDGSRTSFTAVKVAAGTI